MPFGGHGLSLSAGVLLFRKLCMLRVALDRQRPAMSPRVGREVSVTIAGYHRYVVQFGKRLSFCTWVSIQPPAGRCDADPGAAGQPRQLLTHRDLRRRMAPRSSGSAALACRRARAEAAHRSSRSDVPPRSSHRQRPSRLMASTQRYSCRARLLRDGNLPLGFRLACCDWPAGMVAACRSPTTDSGGYSVTTWVMWRPERQPSGQGNQASLALTPLFAQLPASALEGLAGALCRSACRSARR